MAPLTFSDSNFFFSLFLNHTGLSQISISDGGGRFFLSFFFLDGVVGIALQRLRPVQRMGQSGGQLWIVFLERVAGVVDDQIVQRGEKKVRLGEAEASLRPMNQNVTDALVDSPIGDRQSEWSASGGTAADQEGPVGFVGQETLCVRTRTVGDEPISAVGVHV